MGSTNIARPIFVVGSGRSGTTLIYDLLAEHPEFGWFSNWTNQYPGAEWLSLLRSVPFPNGRLFDRIRSRPTMEANSVYKRHGLHDILWQLGRGITVNDVPSEATERFTKTISTHLKYQGKSRFIHKNTNNSMRVSYLASIFPDAKFIHIVRDGRAVALSLTKVGFWPDLKLWWTGETPRKWEADGKDPLLLAGLHWQRQVQEISKSLVGINPGRVFEIQYEKFVLDPQVVLRQLVTFCELPWCEDLDRAIADRKIRNLNDRWVSSMPVESQARVWEAIRETAEQFGYGDL